MPDFLDHLLRREQDVPGERSRSLLRQEIARLIPESPPVRQSPRADGGPALLAASLTQSPDLTSFHHLPEFAIFLYDLTRPSSLPRWFRRAKEREAAKPFWRSDPVRDEEGVLATRAMGADAYCLEVGAFDRAALQFLCEYGRDYDLPAILRCRKPEELAQALLLQEQRMLWLADELAAPELLDLELLQGRTLIMDIPSSQIPKRVWECTLVLVRSSLDGDQKIYQPNEGE